MRDESAGLVVGLTIDERLAEKPVAQSLPLKRCEHVQG